MLLFKPGNVFGFRYNGSYHATVMLYTEKSGGDIYHAFSILTYKSETSFPTRSDIFKTDILGVIIETSNHEVQIIRQQPSVAALWELYPSRAPFYMGLQAVLVQEKELLNHAGNLEYICSIQILPGFDRLGSRRAERDFDSFIEVMADPESQVKYFQSKLFPVSMIYADKEMDEGGSVESKQ